MLLLTSGLQSRTGSLVVVLIKPPAFNLDKNLSIWLIIISKRQYECEGKVMFDELIKLSAFTMGGTVMLVFVTPVASSSLGGSMGQRWYLSESASLA